MSEQAETSAVAPKKVERVVVKVKMQDGREVEFSGKSKLQKSVLEDGTAGVRFDYLNGETRTYKVPAHHLLYAAGHGLGQKLGDNLAGKKDDQGQPIDVDDMVLFTDDLYEKLSADGSDWNQASGGGGGTLLIKALVELKQSTVEKVKAYLSKKTPEEIKAFETIPAVKQIITRLRDDRDAKRVKNVDIDALTAELEAI